MRWEYSMVICCFVVGCFGFFLIPIDFVYSSPIVYNQRRTRNLVEQTKVISILSQMTLAEVFCLVLPEWELSLPRWKVEFQFCYFRTYYLLHQILLLPEGNSAWHIGNISYPVFGSGFGLVNNKLSHLKTTIVKVLCGLGVGSFSYERKGRSTAFEERRKTLAFQFSLVCSQLWMLGLTLEEMHENMEHR